jgi:hypothetical protein
MPRPNAPNYVLMVKPKRQNAVATKVGVAWMDEEGRLSIKLEPCVVLHWNDDLWLSLYPDRNNPPTFPGMSSKSWPEEDSGPPPYGDEDVPF